MKLAIIDIGAGNIFSVIKAIKNLNFSFEIINKSNQLNNYSHLIIPGVAAFGTGSRFLLKNGFKDEIFSFEINCLWYHFIIDCLVPVTMVS